MSLFLYVEIMNSIISVALSQPLRGGKEATTLEIVGEGIFNAILT